MSRSMKLFIGLMLVAVGLSGWMLLTRRSSSTPGADASSVAPTTLPVVAAPVAPVEEPLVVSATTQQVVMVADGSESGARQAAAAMVALDERRLVNDVTAESLTVAVASTAGRGPLVEQAIRQSRALRTKLGDNIVLLSQPLRVRTVRVVRSSSAEIDVWWVKVVSSVTLEHAADIWGTTRVSLVWENNTWRYANEVSRLGPWPTHATDAVTHHSGAVFLAELDGFTPLDTTLAEGIIR